MIYETTDEHGLTQIMNFTFFSTSFNRCSSVFIRGSNILLIPEHAPLFRRARCFEAEVPPGQGGGQVAAAADLPR
jgi:hypothetical protein